MKTFKRWMLFLAVALAIFMLPAFARRSASSISSKSLSALEKTARRSGTAYHWRKLADAYVNAKQYSKAPNAYRKAAAIYRKLGDPNAAKALEMKAERYHTEVSLYYHRPTMFGNVEKYYTRARLEPIYGCYLGAFVDREDVIDDSFMASSQWHQNVGEFNRLIGKKHAVFFTYLGYGRPFPSEWVRHLKQNDSMAHIAFEPDDLNEVQDDEYLQEFAEDARRSGAPIFLRYAGEMNGDWTRYHGKANLYKEKFRLVAEVMRREAPNVAMVWCVNNIPEENIASYYPGAGYVDWVGVNFYSVLYTNGNRDRPGDWINPADTLRYVYKRYSKQHPIMIGEWAATHMSRVDMKPRPEFAINKIGQLYCALPRLYPRIKAVHWLSMDTLRFAMPGRQLNNYSLLDNDRVATHYLQMVNNPYYLEQFTDEPPQMSEEEIAPLKKGAMFSGKVKLSAWVKTYEQRPFVSYVIKGARQFAFDVPGDYQWELDTTQYPNGPLDIGILITDRSGRTAAKHIVKVIIRN